MYSTTRTFIRPRIKLGEAFRGDLFQHIVLQEHCADIVCGCHEWKCNSYSKAAQIIKVKVEHGHVQEQMALCLNDKLVPFVLFQLQLRLFQSCVGL